MSRVFESSPPRNSSRERRSSDFRTPRFLDNEVGSDARGRELVPFGGRRYRSWDRSLSPSIYSVEQPSFRERRYEESPERLISVPSGVDGIWDPEESNDLTVHLDLDIREDLDQELEEFCRLYRIGSFQKARSFFDRNLAEHLEKPHVFMMYAEMLFHQGSYHEICELDPRALISLSQEAPDHLYCRILKQYWELIYAVARLWTMNPAAFLQDIIRPITKDLESLITKDNGDDIGSTEIAIISLLSRIGIANKRPVPFLYDIFRHLDDVPLKVIYDQLLRDGRVWDMVKLLECDYHENASREITGHRFPQSLWTIIEQWAPLGEEDVATTLALLDLTTTKAMWYLTRDNPETIDEMDRIMDYATSLAASVADKSPMYMKSRAYTRWIIATAYSIAIRDPAISTHQKLLQSSKGVVDPSAVILPRYIPNDAENPGWPRLESPAQLVNAMKLAVNTARDLEDYETEALALKVLIVMTENPEEEFKELFELEHHVQGAMASYLESLLSSYLSSSSDDSRLKLSQRLAELIFDPEFERTFTPSGIWMANTMFCNLEKNGPRTEQATKAADVSSQNLHDDLRREILAKMPDFFDKRDTRTNDALEAKETGDLRAERTRLEVEETRLKLRQLDLDRRQKAVSDQQDQDKSTKDDDHLSKTYPIPDEFGLLMQPQFSEQKRVMVAIENVDGATERKEMVYQPDLSTEQSTSVVNHGTRAKRPQPDAIFLTPQKNGISFERQNIYLPSASLLAANEGQSVGQVEETSKVVTEARYEKLVGEEVDDENDDTSGNARAHSIEAHDSLESTELLDGPQTPDASSSDGKTMTPPPSYRLPSDDARRSRAEIFSDPPSEQTSPV
ncbi:hypothetical protein BJ166DRAFT_117015 [Pestalotiopsis sp. NC0098]|nr:hypothetical protein BJ166DRAFT_117015 [Pestalotiopsis sp. NC0098]